MVTGMSRPPRRNSTLGNPGRTKSNPRSAIKQPSKSKASICEKTFRSENDFNEEFDYFTFSVFSMASRTGSAWIISRCLTISLRRNKVP